MNFNVYISKDIAAKLEKVMHELKKNRNAIIREALEEWLEHHQLSEWPADFFDFKSVKDVPKFESYRNEFHDVSEDPLK